MKPSKAILVCADGRTFVGNAVGAKGTARGEVVFTTGMAGYQETLTDPSFAEQIITFTYPHIGNYGTNAFDEESDRVFAKGLVVRDATETPSNQRATESLQGFLRKHSIVGIAGIDTRALTRHIRKEGAMPGLIFSPFDPDGPESAAQVASLKAKAAALPSMAGRDLAHEVSCKNQYAYESSREIETRDDGAHVVVYDFGMKRNIADSLVRRGARVTVVPADTSAESAMALKPDGILLSNGPGDPDAVEGARQTVKELLGQVPVFGICLGHQIMALAIGARTFKMKFGHRGVNQPVQVAGEHRVYVTSQNHGFAVDPESLPANARATFICPNDGTLEGFEIPEQKAMAVQFHPEACPGPNDTAFLFDRFIEML
jgi:carbamoyl-phosphate synthase small subunit